MRALVWFRSDLRLRDNPALHQACREADHGVVGVFVVSRAQWKQHDWGAMKADFVLRNVAELSASLAEINVALRIVEAPTFADVPGALADLAAAVKCDTLFANREYEVNELRRDAEVEKVFDAAGRNVRFYEDQTVIPPASIRTREGGAYSVFTPFKRRWCELVPPDVASQVLNRPRRLSAMVGKPDDVLIDASDFAGRTRADLWPAGENAARKRLDKFVAGPMAAYHDRRDLPAINGTSTLSPYLACGAVSARQCLVAAMTANGDAVADGPRGPSTWISELIWREFYRHVLVSYPRVCMNRPFKPATEHIEWDRDQRLFDAWREGRTGVPIVDAGMRQLAQTGWMHNRVRMITAMYLTKDLFIDWRWGERHFMQHLVDGDLASNNGGWQWSASTGTDAAPYFRIFNPVSQGRKFDPQGVYVRRFLPELEHVPAESIHEPHEHDAAVGDYPAPIIDHAEARRRVLDAFKAAAS